jgi:hypothetical protein
VRCDAARQAGVRAAGPSCRAGRPRFGSPAVVMPQPAVPLPYNFRKVSNFGLASFTCSPKNRSRKLVSRSQPVC